MATTSQIDFEEVESSNAEDEAKRNGNPKSSSGVQETDALAKKMISIDDLPPEVYTIIDIFVLWMKNQFCVFDTEIHLIFSLFCNYENLLQQKRDYKAR